MRWLACLALFGALALSGAPSAAAAPARAGCPQEDDPAWNWVRCGNGIRGVVTMWGTPKFVTCGDLRWLVKHGDLDPHTPWVRGDWSCGRRR